MKTKLASRFLYSAGVLLLITGVAKFLSVLGGAKILGFPDPIFDISFRLLFIFAAVIEIVVGVICFCRFAPTVRISAVAGLATALAVYRFGIFWVGYRKPCSCLGGLTDALHIPPQVSDDIAKTILIYLMLGSYALIAWNYRRKNQSEPGGETAVFHTR